MVRLRTRGSIVVLHLGLALLCGCFEPGGSGHEAPDAGRAGRGGFGGAGGGGFGGAAAGGFGGASGSGQAIDCPLAVCGGIDPNGPVGSLIEPCCAPSGACSIRQLGSDCPELPPADPSCGFVFVGEGELPGCCLDGECGVNVEPLGLGCVSPFMLESLGIKFERRACTAAMDASIADAAADADIDADAGL